MSIEFYILSLLIFLSYFYIKYDNIYFEVVGLFLLILAGPDILYRDLSNYILDIYRDYPFLYSDKIELYLRILYPVSYVSSYLIIYKYLEPKEYRLCFIILTLATLGYSQLFLSFALFFFLLQHFSKNPYLKIIFSAISLLSHLSIIILFGYYLYKYNKKIALGSFFLMIAIIYYNPYLYIMFSSFDDRIELYTDLQGYNDSFAQYTFRSQIFLNLTMLLFSIIHRNIRLIAFVIGVFLFSVAAKSLHAVFIYRFVELLYILYVLILTTEMYNIKKIKFFAVTMFIVFFMNNMIKAFLYN